MTSSFALELIPSRDPQAIAAQINRHRATLPFLEGTKPPVNSVPSKLNPEDSFVGASLVELAAFSSVNSLMTSTYPARRISLS